MKISSLFKKAIYFSILLFMLSSAMPEKSNVKWELKKNKDEVSVYTADVDGSGIKNVKTSTRVNASLSSILALLMDVPDYTRWVYNCKSAYVLKSVSPTELYHYQETSAPWPVSNRDVIAHITIKQDSRTRIVTFTSTATPNYMPEKSGLVRIKEMTITWRLTPKGNNTVDVEYELNVDPGGNIPTSLLNATIVEGPFETTKKMREFIHHAKYENAKLAFIKEVK